MSSQKRRLLLSSWMTEVLRQTSRCSEMTCVGQDQIQCLSGKPDLVKTHLFQNIQLLGNTSHNGFRLVPHTTGQGGNCIIEALDVKSLSPMPPPGEVLGLVDLEGTELEVIKLPLISALTRSSRRNSLLTTRVTIEVA